MDKRVAAIIIKEGKVLLMRRVKGGHEYFTFPGGRIEEYETAEEAVIRELKEGASITIVPAGVLLHFENIPMEIEESFFLVADFSGEPVLGGPEKEHMNEQNQYELVWKRFDEVAQMGNLYPDEARRAVVKLIRERYFSDKRS